MDTADDVFLSVRCPDCKQASKKVLSWLIIHDEITCHHCGHIVDISKTNERVRIQELAKSCSKIDMLINANNITWLFRCVT
jgi:ribosomal protein S27E